MIFDLHIHSKYSRDSINTPNNIIKIAIKKGLNGVAITDHNTIRGSIEAKKVNEERSFQIIVGAEIKTEYGDVIGLFLNEEIKCRKFLEVVDEIKAQGGYSVLAHPYRKFKFPERIIDRVDYVEVFNARSKKEHNRLAYRLAMNSGKGLTAGSDAHLPFEIGGGQISVDSDLKSLIRTPDSQAYGKESNYLIMHGLTIAIEMLRGVLP